MSSYTRYSKLRAFMLTLAVLLASGMALSAQASDNAITIQAISSVSCIPSSLMTVTVKLAVSQNSLRVVRQVSNPARNTTSVSTTVWERRSGTYDFLATIPQNTQPGDTLILTIALTTAGGIAIAHDEIWFDCSTGQVVPAPAGTPGGTASATPPTSPPGGTPNATPCGTFTVTEWGRKTIVFADYPACIAFAPHLTVACRRADGTWTADEVHNITYSPDGRYLSFEVTQHGLCGLFPQPGG